MGQLLSSVAENTQKFLSTKNRSERKKLGNFLQINLQQALWLGYSNYLSHLRR